MKSGNNILVFRMEREGYGWIDIVEFVGHAIYVEMLRRQGFVRFV